MTNDAEDDFTPPAPRSRSRRLRKVALWALGACAVLILVAFGGRWQLGRVGQRQLDATTQKLDADDPGWRLDAVFDAHKNNAPPAKDNAAPEVAALSERIPPEFREWQKSPAAERFCLRSPDHRLPPADAVAAARALAGPTLFVRTDALKLIGRRAGAFPLDLTADPLALRLPHVDQARQVAALLKYEGHLAAVEENPNRGVAAARAALGVSRAIGDEPLLVSQLVRMACAKVGAQTAMQVLAWGEPTDGLAELQAELVAEADVPWFRYGMRGERGYHDRFFSCLEDGSITSRQLLSLLDRGEPGPHHYVAFRAYKPLLPGDRAKCLQLTTRYVEASKLPPPEQLAAIDRIPNPKLDGNSYQHLVTCLILPAYKQLAQAGLCARADLLAAATCVACERFRREKARWPRDLAELVPAYLPGVPRSPFDNEPPAYHVAADRALVYFHWRESPTREPQPSELGRGDEPGGWIGYRVWNPDRRGLPAEERKEP